MRNTAEIACFRKPSSPIPSSTPQLVIVVSCHNIM
ncbi:hypothetical protein EVA_04416 [gut metagenome]|uniref:Uncharacterized protein n=1 Tax=gut metagenome TaxID=749906 RepID=J9GIP1_9ZZZZ